MVHTFCGLYLLRDELGAVLANPGFASEMAEKMIAATGLGPQRMGRVDVLPQHPVEFVRIADELVMAEKSLELSLHSEVMAVRKEEVWKLKLGGRCGERWVSLKAVVDASGDAVVAAEEKFGVVLGPGDITRANLSTPNAMARLFLSKLP